MNPISAAQPSRKHNQVESALLEQVFTELALEFKNRRVLPTSETTSRSLIREQLDFALQKYKWAIFRKTKAGIKPTFAFW